MRDAMRARTMLAVLLFVSMTLVMLNVRDSGAIGGLRGITAAVVGPLERAGGALAAPVVSLVRSAVHFGDVDTRNAVAQRQLRGLVDGPDTAAVTASQAASVASLLRTAGIGGYRVVPARVVAYGMAQTFSGTVTLDAGSRDGLAVDMTVISGDGLVGRIASVGPVTATVQLTSDSDSVVAARVEATDQVGALEGTGDPRRSVLKLLDPTSPLAVGDRLVTFGPADGGGYAPGLPLGTIVGFRGDPGQADRVAIVDSAARLTALDIVGVVVVSPRTDPRDSVLPPKAVLDPARPTLPASPTLP